jgi:hypothetical protein
MTLNEAKAFQSRCENAMESRDWGGADEFCQQAAEHWGDVADSTTGHLHEIASLNKTIALGLEGRAEENGAVGQAEPYASNDKATGEGLVAQALSDAKAISKDASDSEVRAGARSLVRQLIQ